MYDNIICSLQKQKSAVFFISIPKILGNIAMCKTFFRKTEVRKPRSDMPFVHTLIIARQQSDARNRVFAYQEYLGILRKDIWFAFHGVKKPFSSFRQTVKTVSDSSTYIITP